MRRLSISLGMAVLLLAVVLVPAAQASNDGRGFYGATNDHAVTNAGFIIIAFFPILVFALSMIQRHLEKRKEARKAAESALGDGRWQGGW
jgi:hydrogenase-4 membrane subunit HyfE